MVSVNKTRYAILGMLLEAPRTGYEIKSFMSRSTVYFWRESDSTIYPMLKVLANEGKVVSRVVYVGKKRKEIFSITDKGQTELRAWIESPTSSEIPRNEFLLKLFFITDRKNLMRLLRERLERIEKTRDEYKKIEEKLEGLPDSPHKILRLKALRYGLAHLDLEIQWLNSELRPSRVCGQAGLGWRILDGDEANSRPTIGEERSERRGQDPADPQMREGSNPGLKEQ